MEQAPIRQYRDEVESYLRGKLLPFWLERSRDTQNGGFITHFDRDGNDSGEDEKSLIAQGRMLYTFSSAFRAGYGAVCAEYARHAADFLIDRMWDRVNGGFVWMTNRKGVVVNHDKVVYGQSFAIYALSEYTLATGDPRGRQYAGQTFDLLQKHCTDTMYGGYFEMFDSEWCLAGPGSAGGDRKTLDAHMHLMEAYTTLYECTREPLHRRKLLEIIAIVTRRLLHPKYATGIPQFTAEWVQAPQIKFDIVWGWDRFNPDGEKSNPENNTSYGHNVEMAWLLMHALDVLGLPIDEFSDRIRTAVDHAVRYGVDPEYGGLYVEGAHDGPATDLQKEFWQQCEGMIGFLEAYLRFGDQRYLAAYESVHRFMFTKGINFAVGEIWPLLTRQGEPIWTHMSHSWKINYHSVRAMIQSKLRLDRILSL